MRKLAFFVLGATAGLALCGCDLLPHRLSQGELQTAITVSFHEAPPDAGLPPLPFDQAATRTACRSATEDNLWVCVVHFRNGAQTALAVRTDDGGGWAIDKRYTRIADRVLGDQ